MGAALPAAAELAFGRAEFERVRHLIHAFAGIHLGSGKQAMVYSRLARRLRELGQHSFTAYLDALEHERPADTDERQEFVNCLTTNLTSFFREQHHFPLLAQALAARAGRPTRMWCNAASTGEEPYSIAITVLETLGDDAPVELVCSDIDTRVLAAAQRGTYAIDARGLTIAQQRRFFLRGTGPNAGLMRAGAELRRLVQWRSVNLVGADYALGEPFDIVFCRNVMIYFDAPTQRGVLERLHRAMRPQALLFAGHSENFAGSRDLFRLRGQTVYERVG